MCVCTCQSLMCVLMCSYVCVCVYPLCFFVPLQSFYSLSITSQNFLWVVLFGRFIETSFFHLFFVHFHQIHCKKKRKHIDYTIMLLRGFNTGLVSKSPIGLFVTRDIKSGRRSWLFCTSAKGFGQRHETMPHVFTLITDSGGADVPKDTRSGVDLFSWRLSDSRVIWRSTILCLLSPPTAGGKRRCI